jgi:Rrf2 family protein
VPIIHRDTDYAFRALIQLADSGDVVSVTELSERCDVPVDFLRKIMQKLNNADIVKSVQGPAGGYSLLRAPEDISFLEVISAVQGPVVLNACFEDQSVCGNVTSCGVREKLKEFESELEQWLGETYLNDVTANAGELRRA